MKNRTSFGQHTLDREYFVSDEVFAAEHERIFFRSWLLAGHISQLDQLGSYFLFELEHESVVVLRDHEGEIRAFHNHCRHRGSRLCREAQGTLGSAIVCPYHAWAYGLDGALKNVPAMNDVAGFNAADYPLHRVALTNWEGFCSSISPELRVRAGAAGTHQRLQTMAIVRTARRGSACV
jgi:phenylpropionate dioxygenase-like ring-hydroxylating dioxygenase large terminal subunit